MTAGDDHRLDDIAAYALGALPEPELRAVERHLAGCDACARELEAARAVVDALPLATPQLQASAELKSSVMSAVQQRPASRRRGVPAWLARRPLPALAGGLAAAAVALGAYGLGVSSSGGERQVAAVVDQGRLPGARATLAVNDGLAVLRADRLPRLRAGQVYVVWVDRGRGPVYASSFNVRPDGAGQAGIPEVDGVERVMVTRERSTAVTAPTEDPVVTVELT